MLDKILLVVVIAVGFTFIYSWGIVKQQRKGQELLNDIMRKSEEKVLKELKKSKSLTKADIEVLIEGTQSSLFWSKDKIKITDSKIVATTIINNLISKGTITQTKEKDIKVYRFNKN